MTHFSDNIRTGQVFRATNGTNGTDTSPVYVYATTPPVLSATALAAAQTVSGGSFTLQAGSGVTTTTIQGTTYYDLGVARCLRAVGAVSGVTATNITVTGLEETVLSDGTLGPGYPMTITFSGPADGLTTTTTKAIRYVRSVTAAGNTTSGVSIGTTDTFGFPYKVANFGDVIINWNNALITASTGWTAAVTTSPATATTGDVRGTYAVQSGASNDSLVFRAWIFVKDPDTETGLYGQAQYSA
jgi:hypothetical protein